MDYYNKDDILEQIDSKAGHPLRTYLWAVMLYKEPHLTYIKKYITTMLQ